jgi:hypothetical protein
MAASPSFLGLQQNWDLRPWALPGGLLDLSEVDIRVSALESLFRRMPPDKLFVRVPGVGPASGPPKRIPMSEVADLEERLNDGGRLHLLAIDLQAFDPAHARLLQRFVDHVVAAVPEAARSVPPPMIALFMSTPGVVAPFHADCEHNFLLQVVGDKQIHFWDRSDHELLPPLARERLACEEEHVLDTYRPDIEAQAMVFHLTPGTGVYHPPMTPHWVDTGRTSWSLSYAISFETPSVERLRLVHKLNRQLRRFGVEPAHVGRRPLVDGMKLVAARGLRQVKRMRSG